MNAMQSQGPVTIIVGAQWGDEGKGKWIDILAKDIDIVARFQGGNNAGHTLYINGQKFVLHQIPSGVFHGKCVSMMGAGVVVNPVALRDEFQKLKGHATINPNNLWISARAHVITPWHIYLDGKKESSGSGAIGTTKRGIGPTYAEKAARTGLRVGKYVQPAERDAWFHQMYESNSAFKEFCDANRDQWKVFNEAAEAMAPFVCDAEIKLRREMAAGKKILMEGAQGVLLDLDHGTYPYVTSSSTSAPGACATLGFSPKLVGKILGVAKAYATRVGSGPFPSELKDSIGAEIAKRGNEFGATTGRPRRCGWFDAVAFRYSQGVNGFDGVILNKMDILTGIGDVKIATHYMHPTLGKIEDFPWDVNVLEQCTPVYETYPGWNEQVPRSGKISDLPTNARKFVEAVEKHSGCRVMMVGTGPGRDEALFA